MYFQNSDKKPFNNIPVYYWFQSVNIHIKVLYYFTFVPIMLVLRGHSPKLPDHNRHITSVCVVLCLQSTVLTRWTPFSDTATINTCCDCLQYTCLCKTLNSSHSNILLSSYFVIWLAGKIMIYMSKMS